MEDAETDMENAVAPIDVPSQESVAEETDLLCEFVTSQLAFD